MEENLPACSPPYADCYILFGIYIKNKWWRDTEGTFKSFVKPQGLSGAGTEVGEQMGRGRGAVNYCKVSVWGDAGLFSMDFVFSIEAPFQGLSIRKL